MLGSEIEALSFQIIQEEVSFSQYDPYEAEVVARVIHASADPTFASTMVFSVEAAPTMVGLIQSGSRLITDVKSLKTLINTASTICALESSFPPIQGKTRSYAAMYHAARKFGVKDTIFVVGCAPTALDALLDLDDTFSDPPCIVALPVGYVGAAESKKTLLETNYTYITNVGRRGGTAVTAAAINALYKMATGVFQLKH